jgi:hypothetical protein
MARVNDQDHMSGMRWSDAGSRPVRSFQVISDYAGEVELREPVTMRFALAGDDQELVYDATVRSFLPLRHRSGEKTVRIGQVLFDFDGPAGRASGWTDLTRPLP